MEFYSRVMTGRAAKDPVLRAIGTDEEGINFECNSQETMVPLIATSNLARQQKCVGIPFMSSPLVEVFGYLADNNEIKPKSFRWNIRYSRRNVPLRKRIYRNASMPRLIKELKKLD